MGAGVGASEVDAEPPHAAITNEAASKAERSNVARLRGNPPFFRPSKTFVFTGEKLKKGESTSLPKSSPYFAGNPNVITREASYLKAGRF